MKPQNLLIFMQVKVKKYRKLKQNLRKKEMLRITIRVLLQT